MLRVAGLSLRQGAFVIDGLDLTIPERGYTVLMGRSGCGKTTLLECICGLRRHGGSIHLATRDVSDLPPAQRRVGYLPQDVALFPTMRVGEQIALPMQLRGVAKDQRGRDSRRLAERMGIAHLFDRSPQGLSGGEAQRVALARALAAQPLLLCLDEPLAALDQDTHAAMCALLRDIHREHPVTILHVTHNRHEAEAVADRILTMAELTEKNQTDSESS